jgi:hypothetical protein
VLGADGVRSCGDHRDPRQHPAEVDGWLINTFRYKGFDVSTQIDARIGGQLFSATNSWGKYAAS